MQKGCFGSFKVPSNSWYGLHLNIPGYTSIIFLNLKARNIHILVLKYDEEMCSPFRNSASVKNLDDINIYISQIQVMPIFCNSTAKKIKIFTHIL